jgi:hypothetical protein
VHDILPIKHYKLRSPAKLPERGAAAPYGEAQGTGNMRRGAFAGIVPQLRRQLRILDLLPVGTMDQNSLPYTKESGSYETAEETAEGAFKPEAEVVLPDASADAVTIAHWTKRRKQSLSDTPALQSVIDGRLRYGGPPTTVG